MIKTICLYSIQYFNFATLRIWQNKSYHKEGQKGKKVKKSYNKNAQKGNQRQIY